MEKWFGICLLLCLVGFLNNVRPNDAFGVEYLIGPWQNESLYEVMHMIFPVYTYSYASLLIVIFFITDYLLYKPVLVGEGVSYVIFNSILIWAYGIKWMQVGEFFFAAALACEIAYNTYIYAQAPQDKFQIATGYTQAATLIGKSFGHILGQVLISTKLCDYFTINYVSLAFVLAATITSLFLPSASQSTYFHRTPKSVTSSHQIDEEGSNKEAEVKQKSAWRLLWMDFKFFYSDKRMLKWSLWWAFALCGFLQVTNYIQALWEVIETTNPESEPLNGAVEGTNTLLSALAAVAIGYVRVDWSVYGELTIAVISIFESVMLILAATAKFRWVVYVCYILFCVTFRMVFTIASSEVAKGLKQESYGLVFGINTFVAVCLQVILTLSVVDEIGLALGAKEQYFVYGSYFALLGLVFLSLSIYIFTTRKRTRAPIGQTEN